MACSVEDILAEFRIRFPEFASVPDATVELYIGDALAIFCGCCKAVVFLTAHLCALAQDQDGVDGIDGGMGEVASEKIGQKTVTYKTQAGKAADTFYTTTKYGRLFIQFRNKCASRAFTARVY